MRPIVSYPILTIVILALFAGGGYFFLHKQAQSPQAAVPSATTTPSVGVLPDAYIIPGQRTYYTDSDRGFRFELPKGFTVGNYAVGSPQPQLLIQNNDHSDVMLIDLGPAGGNSKTLSAADIARNAPQVLVNNPRPFPIAPDATGVVFGSNGAAWDNKSHEIWFVYEGTLYRAATSARLAPLLDAIISTWRFTK